MINKKLPDMDIDVYFKDLMLKNRYLKDNFKSYHINYYGNHENDDGYFEATIYFENFICIHPYAEFMCHLRRILNQNRHIIDFHCERETFKVVINITYK